jgi:hypothetical protein
MKGEGKNLSPNQSGSLGEAYICICPSQKGKGIGCKSGAKQISFAAKVGGISFLTAVRKIGNS